LCDDHLDDHAVVIDRDELVRDALFVHAVRDQLALRSAQFRLLEVNRRGPWLGTGPELVKGVGDSFLLSPGRARRDEGEHPDQQQPAKVTRHRASPDGTKMRGELTLFIAQKKTRSQPASSRASRSDNRASDRTPSWNFQRSAA